MADHLETPERNDKQPQQQQQQESFDSTKRFHIAFTLFKLLVITHFNSQYTKSLSDVIWRLYIICEAIYLIGLIKVTGLASLNPIYRCLYVIFGTLGSELLLWTSLCLSMWLIVNMCLLAFALACLLSGVSDRFREIVQLFDDAPFSEVQLDS